MTGIPSNNAVRGVIEAMHNRITRKAQGGKYDLWARRDNRLFRLMCADPTLDPGEYAADLVHQYGYDIRGGGVLHIFRAYGLSSPDKRGLLCDWAVEVADQFVQCLRTKKRSDFEELKDTRAAVPSLFFRNGAPMRFLDRILCLALYMRYPELNVYDDLEKLEQFGNTWAKYFFDEVFDILDSYCEDERSELVSESDALKLAYEQEKRKVHQLSVALERANTAMQDLEAEFEERLEEEKTISLTEFFARLNSEKYGCILDELLNVRKGISELKKRHYEPPLEISGLLILIVRLTQFVRDAHIDPIMKMNSIHTVRAEDVANCDYDGSPFRSDSEEKVVRVISSGWIYVDKEIQIARPRLKEVTELDH